MARAGRRVCVKGEDTDMHSHTHETVSCETVTVAMFSVRLEERKINCPLISVSELKRKGKESTGPGIGRPKLQY